MNSQFVAKLENKPIVEFITSIPKFCISCVATCFKKNLVCRSEIHNIFTSNFHTAHQTNI